MHVDIVWECIDCGREQRLTQVPICSLPISEGREESRGQVERCLGHSESRCETCGHVATLLNLYFDFIQIRDETPGKEVGP